MCFLFDNRRWNRGDRFATILCQRFAGKQNLFFHGILGGIGRSREAGLAGILGATIVKTALLGTSRFESTRLAAAIFVAPLVAATVIVATGIVPTRFTTLRRGVFRGRQIPATRTLRAPATMASASPAPASTSATVTTTIAATIRARRVILSRIVLRRKILRGGGVGIRLAFVGVARVGIVVGLGEVRVRIFVARGVVFHDAGLFVVREGIAVRRFVLKGFMGGFFGVELARGNFIFMRRAGMGQRFTRKHLDGV